jgi:hypothetical protein
MAGCNCDPHPSCNPSPTGPTPLNYSGELGETVRLARAEEPGGVRFNLHQLALGIVAIRTQSFQPAEL